MDPKGATTREQQETAAAKPNIQGEGDYEAAQRYREEVGEFIHKADIEDIAHQAAPKSAQDAKEMSGAEAEGRARSKGDDPADAKAMYPNPKPNA